MTADADSRETSPLPSPVRRNCPWWPLQIIIQGFLTFWLSYRARGTEHLPKESGALLLINHRSFLDPLLAGLAIDRPVSFVARHNLFQIPLFGRLLRITYVIPINRDAAGTTSLREIVRRLDHGFLVGLFPEGTRHTGPGALGPLKPGFVSILRRANVPVIPIGIAGASNVMPRGAGFIRPCPVRVVIGEPLLPVRLAELAVRGRESELLDYVAAEMSQAVLA
ncbi:MAG: 1-acyl-sn-glycerol-3-phosphate acyltransferase, partial [Planctomycetaceae bacterium]|nr:1-acyl-sn-glycerol-3-phosphate acyltransferase [Planctomycetaceae bacterium]